MCVLVLWLSARLVDLVAVVSREPPFIISTLTTLTPFPTNQNHPETGNLGEAPLQNGVNKQQLHQLRCQLIMLTKGGTRQAREWMVGGLDELPANKHGSWGHC